MAQYDFNALRRKGTSDKKIESLPLRSSISSDNPSYRAPPFQQANLTTSNNYPPMPTPRHVKRVSPQNIKSMNPTFNLDSSYTTKQQNTLVRRSVNYIAPPNFKYDFNQFSEINAERNNNQNNFYNDQPTNSVSDNFNNQNNEGYIHTLPALTWANTHITNNSNNPTTESSDYFESIPSYPTITYDEEPLISPNSQRRKSLSCLTTLGIDSNMVTQEGILHPGLLSEIIESFKRTSQEIMTGSQILDLIEKAANLPRGSRNYSLLICNALEGYHIFKHTVDEDLPILDGYEEIYVVDIGKLQKPSFAPQSVLTYLTRCYFPTCNIINPCNLPTCPTRKLYLDGDNTLKVVNIPDSNKNEEVNLLSHRKSYSHVEMGSATDSDTLVPSIFTIESNLNISEEAELWIQAVPQEVVDSVSNDEKKRQELIFETIKTERDFVKDMELIDTIFVRSLRQSGVYEKNRVEAVLSTLFYNYREITTINQNLFQKLKKRQKEEYIVDSIGDIFLEWAQKLDCFAHYGGHLAYTQDFIKNEIEYNPKFAMFLKECEKHPESRRLSIQSFVGRATTRLGRYPLLLEGILKKTKEDNSDRKMIPLALDLIRNTLNLVNKLAGEADEKLKINYINSHLYFKPEDDSPFINLDQPGRKFIKESSMKRVSLHGTQNIIMFLFDNVLILAKEKKKVVTEYRAVCPAIPLHSMQVIEEANMKSYYQKIAETAKGSRSGSETPLTPIPQAESDFIFSICSYGKKPTTQYIMASNAKDKAQWIQSLQDAIENCPQVINKTVQIKDVFHSNLNQNHLICSCDYKTNYDQTFLFGCDDGAHILSQAGALRRIIRSNHRVLQIEVIEEYHVLLVLFSDKLLMAYHLEVLNDTSGKLSNMATKLSENVSFFKVGQNGDKKLVISVKHNSLKSYFKTMELVNLDNENKASMKNKLLWQSKHRTGLRFLKKFYVATIANNISFLKTRLAIACGPGFEIVSLDALDRNYGVPELSDPIITNNSQLSSRFINATPLAMLRANPGEFLLCYKGFGLYISNNGKTSRGKNSVIEWQGLPNSFKLIYPNLICFDNNLIEVHRIDTGELLQVIVSSQLNLANPSDNDNFETQCIAESKTQSLSQRVFRVLAQSQTVPQSPACSMDSR